MGKADKERQARRQRMLAREQGTIPGTVPGTTGNIGLHTPVRVRRAPAAPPPPAEEQPTATLTNLRPIGSLIKRRQRRRRIALCAIVAVIAVAVTALTGTLSNSIAMLGDAADTLTLSITRSGGSWPASTGITSPIQIEELAGGFVELDTEDVVVYASYGGRIRTIQPGYARPRLAAGSTRFVVYNRAGTELRVESRTRTLYTGSFENPILLCSMSNNGTLAVITESNRYAAELMVYDAGYRNVFTWQMTQNEGTPTAVSFAPDNRRFAVGTLAARQGQTSCTVYLMDLNSDETGAAYTGTTGSLLLRLEWLSSTKLLAVFDNYVTILNASTMTETARYDIVGGTLYSVSVGGRQTALLVNMRGSNTLVTLDEGLTPLAEIPAGQATGVTACDTAVYLVCADRVQCYGYDGVQRWEQTYDASPHAVLDAAKTLVFTGAKAEILEEP